MDPWAYAAAALVAAAMAFFFWVLRKPMDRYFVRPRLKDGWGTRFDIIDIRTGKAVGFDWHTVARQRCHAMNLKERSN